MKTFFMMTVNGKIEKNVYTDFLAHGETWVVHDKDGEYSVSHAGTGWGVPGCKAFDVTTAMELGKKKLESIDPAKIKEGLEKALQYQKEKS